MEERENSNSRQPSGASNSPLPDIVADAEHVISENFQVVLNSFLSDPNLSDQTRSILLKAWIMEIDRLQNVLRDPQSDYATRLEAAAQLNEKKLIPFMNENERVKNLYRSFLKCMIDDLKTPLKECTLLKGPLRCVEQGQLDPEKRNLNKQLTEALEENHEERIIELLREGADPNCTIEALDQNRSFPALSIAIMQRQPARVTAFLKHGADPNVYHEGIQSTPLTLAIILQDQEMVCALTSGNNSADVTLLTNGIRPGKMALRLGSLEIAEIIKARLNSSSNQQYDLSEDDQNDTASYHTASENEGEENIFDSTDDKSSK